MNMNAARKNVAIIGGGNIGMCLLGDVSRRDGYAVTICASRPNEFANRIIVVDDESGVSYGSGPFRAVDDVAAAVSDADVVLCTLPAFLRNEFVCKITPVIRSGTKLGFFPAYGGVEYVCHELIRRGVVVFGVQKVPYIARTKCRGKIAGILARKKQILVGSFPADQASACSKLIEDLIGVKAFPLPNFLSAALLPGNPLLHTCGSSVYLSGYHPGFFYDHQIYYWREWTDDCSGLLFKMSDEMMAICGAIDMDLTAVKSIQEFYETSTPSAFTEKVHSIPSFQNLLLPMRQIQHNEFIPDFGSRFFVEDFPHGVAMLKALALIVGKNTPVIDDLLDWYARMTGKQYIDRDGKFGKDICETTIPQRYGLETASHLVEFYDKQEGV